MPTRHRELVYRHSRNFLLCRGPSEWNRIGRQQQTPCLRARPRTRRAIRQKCGSDFLPQVGDFAGLFGHVVGLTPVVVGMTLVAVGTSVPDTFASVIAAQRDPFADNAVGNVTGSNAVGYRRKRHRLQRGRLSSLGLALGCTKGEQEATVFWGFWDVLGV